MKLTLKLGDCIVRMGDLTEAAVDALIADPPYDLTAVSRGGSPRNFIDNPYGRTRVGTDRGFMGKTWDGTGIAFSPEFWDATFRVVRPGGTVKVFGGTRTFHRMAAAMELAGYVDVKLDAWIYGSGFPKSMNVSKAIDKMLGATRAPKRLPFSGNMLMRHGGENTRPWMEEAAEKGYHELPGDEPATPEAQAWDGWGTALKPAWEPVVIARRP